MEFLELIPESVSRRVTYENLVAGQTLFLENDPAQAFFALESSQIRLLHYTESGQVVQHYRIFAGESFAEITLFNDRYLCTAIAETPSRVVIFPKQPFLDALQQDAYLSTKMMEQLARRLHQAKTLINTQGQIGSGDQLRRYFYGDLEPLGVQPGGAGMVVNLYNKANDVTFSYCATFDVVVAASKGKIPKFPAAEVK